MEDRTELLKPPKLEIEENAYEKIEILARSFSEQFPEGQRENIFLLVNSLLAGMRKGKDVVMGCSSSLTEIQRTSATSELEGVEPNEDCAKIFELGFKIGSSESDLKLKEALSILRNNST